MDLPQLEPLEPPYETLGDIATKRFRDVGELVTFGTGREVLENWFGTSYETRLEHWRVEVANRILKLEREGLTIESLQKNDQFLSALAQATQSARRTHEQDKLDALKNAVMSSVISEEDDSAKQVFMLWVDSLSAYHLKVLRWLQNPSVTPHGVHFGGEKHLERFPGDKMLLPAAIEDLKSRKLTWMGQVNASHQDRRNTSFTTELGDRFLDFIADTNSEPPS